MNKVMLIGNLGADPELRYNDNGFAICKFSLATSRGKKDKDSGEWISETNWHRVVALGNTAEAIGRHFRKGQKIHIEGYDQTRSWEDKNTGETRYITETIAERFEFLTPKGDSKPSQSSAPPMGDFDDDIPF